jgi:hypothetical protein
MLIKLNRIIYKFREDLSNGNFWNFIHTQIFLNRIATPVEMDLTALPKKGNSTPETDFRYIELKLNDLLEERWLYSFSSRRYKALQFLKKGWRGFAVIKDSNVVGDVWCAPYSPVMAHQIHPDLKMLGIHCNKNEAYAFDMLIDPLFRGKNLAVPLHKYLHQSLMNEDFQRVYGYYWNDNLPALWMHRMMKFHELPKRIVTRFFSFISSKPLDQPSTSS